MNRWMLLEATSTRPSNFENRLRNIKFSGLGTMMELPYQHRKDIKKCYPFVLSEGNDSSSGVGNISSDEHSHHSSNNRCILQTSR